MDIIDLNFGLEIELTGLSREEAISLLQEALSQHLAIERVRSNKITTIDGRVWKIVSDNSITPMIPISKITSSSYLSHSDVDLAEKLLRTAYIEFVSPICTLRDWEVIRTILRTFRANGGKTNESCGLHIHVDGAYLSGAYLMKLMYVNMCYENIIYKVLGVHPNRKKDYCKAMNPQLKRGVRRHIQYDVNMVTKAEVERLWKDSLGDYRTRYYGLNLDNLLNTKRIHTIEFRYFNSTLHAGKIRSYLYLIHALLSKADIVKNRRSLFGRSYQTPTISQFKTWLVYMGLDTDPNVYTHLINGFQNENYYS